MTNLEVFLLIAVLLILIGGGVILYLALAGLAIIYSMGANESPRDVYKRQNVKRVYARERGQSFPETDGMITDVPGICLVTSYADCVPLYFVDPVKKVIGLSHSGWREMCIRDRFLCLQLKNVF